MNQQSVEPLNGFAAIAKPSGISSAQAVAKLQKSLPNKNRCGHSGTLDLEATGLLIIACGRATRLIRYLRPEKRYQVMVQLGVVTDTDDLAGTVTATNPVPDNYLELVQLLLSDFCGKITQAAPSYSALKHKGKPLYAYARNGEEAPTKVRTVEIDTIELVADYSQGKVLLDVRSKAGVYMRSLARDLGHRIGCGGTMACLVRTECNGFKLTEAAQLDNFSAEQLLPIKTLLSHLPMIKLNDAEVKRFCNGSKIPIATDLTGAMLAVTEKGNSSIGVAQAIEGLLSPNCVVARDG